MSFPGKNNFHGIPDLPGYQNTNNIPDIPNLPSINNQQNFQTSMPPLTSGYQGMPYSSSPLSPSNLPHLGMNQPQSSHYPPSTGYASIPQANFQAPFMNVPSPNNVHIPSTHHPQIHTIPPQNIYHQQIPVQPGTHQIGVVVGHSKSSKDMEKKLKKEMKKSHKIHHQGVFKDFKDIKKMHKKMHKNVWKGYSSSSSKINVRSL